MKTHKHIISILIAIICCCSSSIITAQVTGTITVTVVSTPTITLSGDTLYSSAATGNQWFDDSGIIIGATDSFYIPTTTGSFYAIVSDTNGCASDSSNTIYYIPTWILIFTNNDYEYIIYPNPTSDYINIENKRYTGNVIISIFNMHGELLHEQVMVNSSAQIDVSNYSAGAYLLRFKNGRKTSYCRIIKEE